MALAALIALSPTAKALTLTYEDTLSGHPIGAPFIGGQFRINLQDFDMGTVYPTRPDGTATGFGEGGAAGSVTTGITAVNGIAGQTTATGASPLVVGGEDTWGIAKILTITDAAGSVIWSETGKNAQLTVMFYGESDFYQKQLAGGFSNEDGVNLHADVYLQSKTDPSYTQYNPLGGSAGRLALDKYNTVTDSNGTTSLLGVPILTTVSKANFIHAAGVLGGLATEFNSTFNNTSGGQGQAYLDVTGGTDAAQFNLNGFTSPFVAGTTADLFAQFTTVALGAPSPNQPIADWLVSSNDPIRGNALGVPDTGSTLLMLGLGLGFLAEAYRRRSKNA